MSHGLCRVRNLLPAIAAVISIATAGSAQALPKEDLNVVRRKRLGCVARDTAVSFLPFPEKIKEDSSWIPPYKQAVTDQKACLGMSRTMMFASWGLPRWITTHWERGTFVEEYTYRRSTVVLRDYRVVEIRGTQRN
jgi:hypothetical protein